jgi:hypothetical protein
MGITSVKDRIVLLAVFATLGLIGMFMSAHPVTAQSSGQPSGGPNVTIAGPLPVPVAGTVSATQSGPWNVGITGGLPPLTFPSGATLAIGNSPSNPVPIHDVDRDQEPYNSGIARNCFFAGAQCQLEVTTVPAGKRLVIEHVSGEILTAPGTQVDAAIVQLLPSGATTGPEMIVVPQLVFADASQGRAIYAFNHPTKLYFDQNQTVLFSVYSPGATSNQGAGVSVTGYFMTR